MALPNKLMSARMTNATVGSAIDDQVGEMEEALCDIAGIPIDTEISAAILGSVDSSGRITGFPRINNDTSAGDTAGIRMKDETNSDEVMVTCNNGYLRVYENTGTEAVPIWTERNKMELATGAWEAGSGDGLVISHVFNDGAGLSTTSGAYVVPGGIADFKLIVPYEPKVKGFTKMKVSARATQATELKVIPMTSADSYNGADVEEEVLDNGYTINTSIRQIIGQEKDISANVYNYSQYEIQFKSRDGATTATLYSVAIWFYK